MGPEAQSETTPMKKPLLAGLLGLLGFLSLAASSPQTYVLNLNAGACDVAAHDLNGDERKDIIVLACDEKSYPLNKYIAVFLWDAQRGYPGTPSATLMLDPATGPAFFAEIDGKSPKELVVIEPSGATYYRFQNDALERLGHAAFTSLHPTGSRQPVFLNDAAADLNGDGKDEWLIPVPSGYEIRNEQGLIAHLKCDVISEIRNLGNLVISHKLPAIETIELPGQENMGIAFLSDEFADFSYGENWSRHERYRIPLALDDKWEANARMADINHDGQPDLIITQTQGTLELKVLTQVYIASAPFTYPEEPTATYRTNGALISPFIRDVNGDGKQDLIFVSIPFSIKTFFNFFIRKKLTVKAVVYLFEENGYPEVPSFRKSLTLDAPNGREQVAFAFGDFTGDGRIDAAFGSDEEKLVVYQGSEKDFLASRPTVELAMPTFGIARTEDLDGNAAEDIILFHPGGEHRTRVEVIVF